MGSPFIHSPMVCRICGKLGHTTKQCKFDRESRCKICCEANHNEIIIREEDQGDGTIKTYQDRDDLIKCPHEDTGWCTNCKSPGHWPKNQKCSKYRDAQDILKYKAENNNSLTFAEIRKI